MYVYIYMFSISLFINFSSHFKIYVKINYHQFLSNINSHTIDRSEIQNYHTIINDLSSTRVKS